MRFFLPCGLAVAVLAVAVPSAHAQQRYYSRTSVARSSPPRDSSEVARDRGGDRELTRYGRPRVGISGNGEYRRASVESPTRAEPRPSPPPVSRDYFPGLPTGYGPNQNLAPSRNTGGRPHCVPSRGGFLVGR